MAWKLENMRKDPNSKESYADLFISQIKEEPKTACLFTIGDARAVEIILEKYKNTQFVVFDYPALTKFLDFAKPKNLFKAIPIKYDWESEAEFLEFVEVEMQKTSKEIEGTNMSFDLIIANPPYGKSSSLSKKIVNKMLKCKIAKEMVVLVPDNTFKDDFLRSKLEPGFSFADPKGLFGLDTGGRLIIAKVNKDLNDEKGIEDIFLDKKATTLLKAIAEYNSKVEHTFWNIDGTSFAKKWNYELKDCNKKEQFPEEIKHKKFCECVEEGNLFFKPLFWPCTSPKVLVNSYEGQYNIQGKWLDEFNEKRAGDVLVFKNKKERDNFYRWTTQHYGSNYTWIGVPYDKYLCGYIRKAIRDLIGQGAGASFFTKYLPHVDWSRPWTDAEILKEIGLPEDFLGE